MKCFLFSALCIVLCNVSAPAFAQTNSVTLISYYPAPMGAYDRLRLVPSADRTGACTNDGTIYFKNSDDTLQVCAGNIWVPLKAVWSTTAQPSGFDGWTLAAVDQYYLSTPYPNLTLRKPWLSIGTDNPRSPLHIVVDDTGTPETLTFENIATTHGSPGPGTNISFFGPIDGSPQNEHVAFRPVYHDLTAAAAESYIELYLRDTNGSEEQKFLFSGRGYLGLNYFFMARPPAILSIAGSFSGPNTLPYMMISTNKTAIKNGNVLTVLADGKIGINLQAPTEQLEIIGSVKATTLILTSDAQLKKDIIPVSNALNKISQLDGVSFQWENKTLDQRKHLGVLAQNVEKVFPEIVYDNAGTKSVDYPALLAPLIEAIKELKQNNQILNQQFQQQSAHILRQQQKIKSLQYAFESQALNTKPGSAP